MKKLLALLLPALFLFSLSGCYQSPAAAVDGTPWAEDWELIGTVMGVEAPENGLTLMDNNGALAAMDIFYATWTIGEATAITNEDDEEAQVFDAQLTCWMMAIRPQKKPRKPLKAGFPATTYRKRYLPPVTVSRLPWSVIPLILKPTPMPEDFLPLVYTKPTPLLRSWSVRMRLTEICIKYSQNFWRAVTTPPFRRTNHGTSLSR